MESWRNTNRGDDIALVILHEMGHILGLVNVWDNGCGVGRDACQANPRGANIAYTCPNAQREHFRRAETMERRRRGCHLGLRGDGGRGDAEAATWDSAETRVAATPRPPRGHSVETGRVDAVAATWTSAETNRGDADVRSRPAPAAGTQPFTPAPNLRSSPTADPAPPARTGTKPPLLPGRPRSS